MDKICKGSNLLRNEGGVIRLPFLVKGELVVPPVVSQEQVSSLFSGADKSATYARLPHAQLVREPVIDRKTMKYTGEYIYQVMPQVNARELVETDFDRLASELYDLTVEEILGYVEALLATLVKNRRLVKQVFETSRLTSEFPDYFLDRWATSFCSVFNRETARQMIDTELSFQGRPGSDFLNGWVEMPVTASKRGVLKHGGKLRRPVKAYVRAMPTRQLHITAGNALEVPLISALRAVLTKSAAVIKLPYNAIPTGALFAVAAYAAAPEHPLTKNLSVVYWPGGDDEVEDIVFMPNAFDRVVVWGSPETVSSVQSRALFARVIAFNPRYGVSLIGGKAFSDNLEDVVTKASADVMIYNQKACTSSLVHYVEGTEEQVSAYAAALCKALAEWDKEAPGFVAPSVTGQIKRMRRGKYANANWLVNNRGGDFSSGVVVMPGGFDILDHPMSRLVVVRPVANLEDSLKYLSQHVSTVGIYPEEQRLRLGDRILARGVSSILPLGQCEHIYAGMPHDNMRVLSELVDWKNKAGIL